MGRTVVAVNPIGEFKVSYEDVGQILSEQRIRLGLSQGAIAKKLGYQNVNFISMLENGRSKIPMNRVDALTEAYHLPPEFILVILRSLYPDFFETIYRLARKVPRIFKEAVKNPDEEVYEIYENIKESLKIR